MSQSTAPEKGMSSKLLTFEAMFVIHNFGIGCFVFGEK